MSPDIETWKKAISIRYTWQPPMTRFASQSSTARGVQIDPRETHYGITPLWGLCGD